MWKALIIALWLFAGATTGRAQSTYIGNSINWKQVTQAYDTPPIYEHWWREVANCAQIGSLQGLPMVALQAWKFNVVNADAFTVVDEGPKAFFTEYTLARLHSIYIIKKYVSTPKRIKHEMLHAMLASLGQPYSHTDSGAQRLFDRCSLNFSLYNPNDPSGGDSSENYSYPNITRTTNAK